MFPWIHFLTLWMKSSSKGLFDVVISEEAASYFEQKLAGLGIRFSEELRSQLNGLKRNPFFQVRYQNVRCLPMKNFPFLIHFTIEETVREVNIRAVLHTSLNPKIRKRK